LPFENNVLTTQLSTLEVLKRIQGNMEPESTKLFAFNRKFAKPYSGNVEGLTFTLRRNINYRNSFLPVIDGRIETIPGKTQVKITMRLDLFVAFFVSLWLGIMGYLCISLIISGGSERSSSNPLHFFAPGLVPFGMFAFGYLLTTLSFKSESKKSLQFLSGLLESEPN
jgi:hypothetical protein